MRMVFSQYNTRSIVKSHTGPCACVYSYAILFAMHAHLIRKNRSNVNVQCEYIMSCVELKARVYMMRICASRIRACEMMTVVHATSRSVLSILDEGSLGHGDSRI